MLEYNSSALILANTVSHTVGASFSDGPEGVEASEIEGVKKQKKNQFTFNASSAEAAAQPYRAQ